MHLKIFYLFILLNTFSAKAQKVLNNTFYGYWGDTEWKYEFFSNNKYRATSIGHFGSDTSSGYYRINENILYLTNRSFVIEKDSCIIALDLNYDYCVNREVKIINNADGTWQEDVIYSKIRKRKEIRKLKRRQ